MKSLSDLSIDRPVLATVFSLLIVLVGLIAYPKLPVREYPDIDPPVTTVTSIYPGANASVIETEVTEIIEEELSGIEGIRSLTSTSRDGVSQIIVEFNLERNIDIAAQDVRDKVSRIRSRLPDNVEEPIIAKADADAQPIMWIMVKSSQRDLLDLSEYVDREIKDSLQTISGVSKVIFGGARRRSIQILIDPKRLAFYGLTILDVNQALTSNNIELPAGRILSPDKEFAIKLSAKLKNPAEYAALTIRSEGAVKLGDIANITEGAENDRSFIRFNGQQGFGLGILRQAKSNTIEISDKVRAKIDELRKRLPKDIDLDVGFDASTFIRLSLDEVYNSIYIASFLVFLIIYLFLGNLRATIIPAISIPISLIGTMAALHMMNFSINLMTLLGMIIAVGIVVDDSIIVVENIFRSIESGLAPIEAAKQGTKQITLAVIATTLVLISIFLPIAFMTGITGRLLSEFAFSICFATLISAFVALTMAPMLSSKLLRRDSLGHSPINIQNIEERYQKILGSLLRKPIQILAPSLIACLIGIIFFYNFNNQDFIPSEDRGVFYTIIQTPRGSNLDYIDKQIRKVENIFADIPEINTAISVAAWGLDAPGKVSEGIIVSRLVDWKDRKRNVFSIVGPLYPVLGNIPEAFILPITPQSGPSGGFGAQPIQLVIKSNDQKFLMQASSAITAQATALPSILFARSNLSFDKPELSININRDKALSLGVEMLDIAKSLEILFTGIDLTEFNIDGQNYKTIVSLAREDKDSPQKIGEFALRNRDGDLIQLSNLISIQETIGAEELNHHDRKKAVTINASPKAGFTPAQGLAELESLTRKIIQQMPEIPADYSLDYIGTSKELKDANLALFFGFFVALIFAYLFLAAQFESFISPLIIMLTVPLALVGALASLAFFKLFPLLTGMAIGFGAPEWIQFVIPQFKNISINVYSQIGMIMLIGIASKNGILIVEFINQLREEGLDLDSAITKASALRLRPIVMTALSTMLGILPIALALGVGAESRQSMGIAVIGGLVVATLLTLFIVPLAYKFIHSLDKNFGDDNRLNHNA